MGCFNGTCMISNLPISYDEEVKVVLLKSNKLGKTNITSIGSGFCHIDEFMYPVFLPFDAKYDDYGSVKDIKEDFNTELILNDLKKVIMKIRSRNGNEKEDYNLYDFIEYIRNGKMKHYKQLTFYDRLILTNVYNKKKVSNLVEWYNSDITFGFIKKSIYDGIVNNDIKDHFYYTSDGYVSSKEYYSKKFDETLNGEYSEKPLKKMGYSTLNIYSNIIQQVKDRYIELSTLEHFMEQTRRHWNIQSGFGSQDDSYNYHRLISNLVINICDEEETND